MYLHLCSSIILHILLHSSIELCKSCESQKQCQSVSTNDLMYWEFNPRGNEVNRMYGTVVIFLPVEGTVVTPAVF